MSRASFYHLVICREAFVATKPADSCHPPRPGHFYHTLPKPSHISSSTQPLHPLFWDIGDTCPAAGSVQHQSPAPEAVAVHQSDPGSCSSLTRTQAILRKVQGRRARLENCCGIKLLRIQIMYYMCSSHVTGFKTDLVYPGLFN